MVRLVLLVATMGVARAQHRAAIGLNGNFRGNAAITALGNQLPAVAQAHGLQAQTLATLFRAQAGLMVDRQGVLLFSCEGLAVSPQQAATVMNGPAASGPAFNVNNAPNVDAFHLHSLPGATRVIYLDFDGHTTTGTQWNTSFTSGAPIVSDPFDLDGSPSTFNATELNVIRRIWQRVAEDYAPFNVDVTTEDPGIEALRKTSATDMSYGVRVVISPTNWYSASAGGVAYIGSFNWNSDTPCYAFTAQLANGEKYIAESAAHEVGHTLGLYHDGLGGSAPTEYYQGQGSWAPIMGVSYYMPVSQFSRGEYANANNLQDDLATIATFIPVATDDHGNTLATASVLTGPTVSDGGTIETNTDVDVFRFDTGAGAIALTIQTPSPEADLDIKAELLDSTGQVLQTSDPAGMSAAINANLAAGTYYLRISGTGSGDPVTTGYSNYGSLGNYLITGNLVAAGPQRPVAVASASVTSGTVPLSVTFSSQGSADPDGTIASYQWDFGNGASSTAANPTYTYNTTGTFTAVLTVTDNTGLTGTASVVITVNPASSNVAPVITTNPVTQTGLWGSSVTFTVAASGTPAPTYQWRKNGTAINGWTGSSLVLPVVTENDVAVYSAVATNVAGSATSTGATLYVSTTPPANVAPSITTQPSSQTVTAGTNVTFTAAASGTPTPTYQWRKNGTAIAGATNASLVLSGVTTADAADYTLVATNAAGSATSNAATLTVNPPSGGNVAPVITTNPATQTGLWGSSVTFTVAASGTPAPTYQWRKNGIVINGWTGSSLVLPFVTENDVAVYSAIATNVAGSATSAGATLYISTTPPANVAPSITTQPSSQTVTSGVNVTFSAAASGTPTPTFQWRKNGTAIAGATNASLVLSGVTTADAADYTLIATNAAGSATSNIATLTVNPPAGGNVAPVITLQPAPQTGTWGSSVTFTVAASGTPAPTYQWLRNGVPVAGWTGPSLTIPYVTPNDVGAYSAVATNAAGSVTSQAATLTYQ